MGSSVFHVDTRNVYVLDVNTLARTHKEWCSKTLMRGLPPKGPPRSSPSLSWVHALPCLSQASSSFLFLAGQKPKLASQRMSGPEREASHRRSSDPSEEMQRSERARRIHGIMQSRHKLTDKLPGDPRPDCRILCQAALDVWSRWLLGLSLDKAERAIRVGHRHGTRHRRVSGEGTASVTDSVLLKVLVPL